MARPTIAELRTVTYKKPDAWWTVLLVDPVAVHLVRWAAPFRWITPNRVTVAAFLAALGAAGCFLAASRPWLIAGAALFYLAFLLDCVDGKLARWQGSGSLFGAWLDYILDRVRVLICVTALMGGQYLRTGQAVYLLLGILVVFFEMFRYVDSHHMEKVKAEMAEALRRADAAARPEVAFNESWRRRFSIVVRFRAWTEAHRIRPHLMSGIEFEMFVLVVAPLTGAVLGVTVAACAVMLVFELAMVYKFSLSARDFRRALDRAAPATEPQVRNSQVPASST
jgi:phosphatidylglycerophosphate synthase